jgi:hypothetical protein
MGTHSGREPEWAIAIRGQQYAHRETERSSSAASPPRYRHIGIVVASPVPLSITEP